MDIQDELLAVEARRRKVYGPARLGRRARMALWLLRLYVVGMAALVVVGFVRQLH